MQQSLMNPNVQSVEWNPTCSRSRPSTRVLLDLKVGEVKKIIHDDMTCRRVPDRNSTTYQCSLKGAMDRIRKATGRLFEYYHEKEEVLVVRRIK